jgi:hypothetical protein
MARHRDLYNILSVVRQTLLEVQRTAMQMLM